MLRVILIFALLVQLAACASSSKKQETTVKDRRADILFAQGTSQLMSQEYTDALENLMLANQARPNDSQILNNLGMAYFFKGQPGLAERHIRQSVQVDPNNSDARNNLASILFTQNRLDEAKAEYIKVQDDLLYRHQWRVKYNLALIHLRQQNRAEAVRLLKEASAERQDYCAANYQLGMLYRESRNFKDAIEWFKRASDGTCYGEVEPHLQLAELYELTRDMERARLKYEDIVERFATGPYAPIARERLQRLEETAQMAGSSRSSQPSAQQEAPRFQSPRF
jgi:type IV pilus assembly protein PilF